MLSSMRLFIAVWASLHLFAIGSEKNHHKNRLEYVHTVCQHYFQCLFV